jgi:HPt (histidine-containing phosphotransfer) domain-containing protein
MRRFMAQISIKDPQEIPEVMAYLEAKQLYENFKQMNPQFIENLRQFLEHLNQTREAADKAVRAAGVSCSEFDLYQQVEKVDGDKVLSAKGREKFIAMGGSIKTKHEAKIGIKQLKTALARGEVDQELYEECVKTENRYHTPDAGALP